MLTLYLFRHAKSDWGASGLADSDRPLNKRGRDAAKRMGRYCAGESIVPQQIYCSTALRTRQTLELFLEAFADKPPFDFEERLYLATTVALLKRIRHCRSDLNSVMLLAHNPGTHALAFELIGQDDCGHAERLQAKFPTAALAELAFDIDDWRDVGPGKGILKRFAMPKTVPA